MPMAPWPLLARMPTISQEKFFTRTALPRGLWPAKSFCLTVLPMTHTALPARISSSLNWRPAASFQLPATK